MLNRKVIFGFLIFVVVSFTIFSLAQTPDENEEGGVEYPPLENVGDINLDEENDELVDENNVVDEENENTQNPNPTTPTTNEGDNNPTVVKYTITFNSNGGSAVLSQTVNKGAKATKKEPTRSGYIFVEWRVDSVAGAVYNFNNAVNSNLTLVAVWKEEPTIPTNPTVVKYTITFNSNGGSAVLSQTVNKGAKATKKEPTRSGYIFVEWRVGSVAGAVYNFNNAVNSNLTLVAVWKEEPTIPTNPTEPSDPGTVTPPPVVIDNSMNKKIISQLVSSGDGLYSTSGTMKYIYKGSNVKNYVYYSGLIWRIVGITSGGNMKLVSDIPLATMPLHDSSVSFGSSYAYSWLNGYFKSNLHTGLLSSGVIELIAEGDFNNSNNGNTYLRTNSYTWTMTLDGSNYKYLNGTTLSSNQTSKFYNIKPVIYISASVDTVSGNGTSTSPFILNGGTKSLGNYNLNNRVAGEYVSFDGKLWRVVETGSTTKLVLDSIKNLSSTITDIRDYSYENFISSSKAKLVEDASWKYILGNQVQNYGGSSFLNGQPSISGLKVGMLRVGEIFSGYDLNTSFVVFNADSSYKPYRISASDINTGGTTNFRPAIYLKSDVKITSGNGTKASPFQVSQ